MDAAAGLGRNPVSKHQISLSREMSKLTRDGAAEPVSRNQILRRERGQGNIDFLCLVPSPSETWFRGMSVGGSFWRE